MIGYYIVEFEQQGEDRASYGSRLLSNLAKSIGIKGLTAPELSRCRQFYQCYPQILGSLTQEFKDIIPERIFGTASSQSELLQVPPEKIISKLSFTHLVELIKIDDPFKRIF
ncbi:DUF1016 N-terminal domain-containing protein [Telluribacter humicola]|uniref:DUF1016 N-terminal domain-containing protein n=1 Tax=Telluribacter humicola TaxID=1720261 RepID=UPI001E652F73|nr:DUF1016 N-terminal domain-containing protein [Telluribacter humicola]